MKKLLFIVGIVLSATSLLPAQNLIQNGDFEDWKRTGSNPASWQISYNRETASFEHNKDKQQGNFVRLKEMNLKVRKPADFRIPRISILLRQVRMKFHLK
jgi:hypothetical protein